MFYFSLKISTIFGLMTSVFVKSTIFVWDSKWDPYRLEPIYLIDAFHPLYNFSQQYMQ